MADSITLTDYEEAERLMAAAEARRGILVHATISFLVAVAMVVINVVVAPQFPWSPFPVVGLSIGLLAHYVFGVHRLKLSIREHQQAVERRAAHLHVR